MWRRSPAWITQPVSGTLVFDDYEMSKTILIPIIDAGSQRFGGHHE